MVFIVMLGRNRVGSGCLRSGFLCLFLILLLCNYVLIFKLVFSNLFFFHKAVVNHISRGSIRSRTHPSIKLRKFSIKIITKILTLMTCILATKSNPITLFIRNGSPANPQSTFLNCYTFFCYSPLNNPHACHPRDRLIVYINVRIDT